MTKPLKKEQERKEKMWKTKNGDILKISDMSDSHLLNAIAMLKRQSKTGVLIDAPKFDIDNWVTEEIKGRDYLVLTGYFTLLAEARRRGLRPKS